MSARQVRGAAWGIVGIVAVVAAVSVPSQELPQGVSERLIASGDSIYKRAGCGNCHGAQGRGLEDTGSDLTDDIWTFTDGSYPGIVALISTGITAEESTHGMPMPPKAAVFLTPAEIEAVSAYVWALRRDGA